LTISPDKFIRRIIGNNSYKELQARKPDIADCLRTNIMIITDEAGNCIGRAALLNIVKNLDTDYSLLGVLSAGGLRVSELRGIIGILVGEPQRAARDVGLPIISADQFFIWANHQLDLLAVKDINYEDQIATAEIAKIAVNSTGSLKIARHQNGYMS
jgi:hypothetical protein